MSTVTDNRNLALPTPGGDTGVWGTLLNNSTFTPLDSILGATVAVSITVADVTLTLSQWNNAIVRLSGVLTGNRSLILPLNPNSATVSVGGLFVVDNTTTGSFAITVKTSSAGSTGVVVPQGVRCLLFSDTTNVWFADDSKAQILTFAGNPNGSVAGTAATSNTPPSACWDYTNNNLYICTTTGTALTAVWTNTALATVLANATLSAPQGRLTPTSNTPVPTGDVTASIIYYTPYVGAQAPVHNGTTFIPQDFVQMQLTLTSAQAANSIYDVFFIYNGGTVAIGTGPAWSNITPGTCSRGTGAGTTQLSRNTDGLLVNTVSMNVTINTGGGNSTVVVAAGQALYLGSIYVDATAGQVTSHRTTGQNRKFGVWNYYNRSKIALQVSDPTASWDRTGMTANVVRASDNKPSAWSATVFNQGSGTTSNGCTIFNGFAESECVVSFNQAVTAQNAITSEIGMGINSVTVFSGQQGYARGGGGANIGTTAAGSYIQTPTLGLTTICCCERVDALGSGSTFFGDTSMLLIASYEG